jgi:hypothetical protein
MAQDGCQHCYSTNLQMDKDSHAGTCASHGDIVFAGTLARGAVGYSLPSLRDSGALLAASMYLEVMCLSCIDNSRLPVRWRYRESPGYLRLVRQNLKGRQL